MLLKKSFLADERKFLGLLMRFSRGNVRDAKQILNRLSIDLAWNSSRLDGNTYSLLDTKRLIELGEEAEGRAHLEA